VENNMSFLRLQCPASGGSGWKAWIPVALLLVVITVQLVQRASGDAEVGSRSASESAASINGREQ
jgi:hypothetical protein